MSLKAQGDEPAAVDSDDATASKTSRPNPRSTGMGQRIVNRHAS